MAFIHRVITFGLIPIIALIALQLYSPETFHNARAIFQPYISSSRIRTFDSLPRSETRLFISAVTHWSHFEKIAKVAVALAELGYPITLITGRIFKNEASSLHPNITFYPLLGQDDKLTEEQYATMASLPPEEVALYRSRLVLVDGMSTTHDTLQQVFREFRDQHGNDRPLLSFYDVPVTGHLPILLGAPGIKPDVSFAIGCHPILLDSNDTYPFHIDKRPETGPDARAIHWKAYQDRHQDYFTRELDLAWWAKLREMGAIQDSYGSMLHAASALPDHLMMMGIPEFEWPRTDLRSNIHYFGALKSSAAKTREENLPSLWDDVAKAKREGKKIVAVSQGTVETNFDELLIPTLEALKDRDDVLVVATTVVVEPEDTLGFTVRGNVRATRFVPYELLLPLTDVLVSNGGFGAVMTAMSNGIPVVVAGSGQDKDINKNLVQYTDVGVKLEGKAPGVDKIREGVGKVLDDPMYKKNMGEMRRRLAAYDVGRVFDGVIREAVRGWAAGKGEDVL
ncbi:UDP-Glycosyltransferase/glycogen phosphorylase [Decorospora gaudefroyi]|uniref:UDP-Glycosyltransferase/glycogen phosphorylase n=1 Tax=Decorospora gaudefroyi TaxID=184978 RepID=A0A6A5KK36_9PLEO|nr:UDP-Glycosyltransferase/glycogen phosphorylase [Decorospora gaudefroyi]